MEITLKPTKKQDIVWDILFDDITKEVLFGGGAGGGKSWVGCEYLLTSAIRYPYSTWFIGRKELKRLMNTTFKTFLKVCRHHNIPEGTWKLDGQFNIIKFANGSEIHLLDTRYLPTDPMYERFGSYEFTGGFGDEVNEWEFDAYDVLKSRTGRNNVFDKVNNKMISPPEGFQDKPTDYPDLVEITPKVLGGCNPSKNWVFHEFYKPWENNSLPAHKAFVQSLYTDNPYTASMYGEQLSSMSNEVNKQRLRDGNWKYEDGDDAMFSSEHLYDMFTNTIIETDTMYLIVDAARFGSDSIVFNVYKGLRSIKRIKKQKQGTDVTAQNIVDLCREYSIARSNVLVDEDGIGGGILDQVPGVRGFVNNSSPIKQKKATKTTVKFGTRMQSPSLDSIINPNFDNLKAQCAYKLGDYVMEHLIAVDSDSQTEKDEIVEDLSTIKKYKQDEEGKLRIAPKKEAKESLKRSPDVGDTFLMRMWFVIAEEVGMENLHNDKAIKYGIPRNAVTVRRQRNI